MNSTHVINIIMGIEDEDITVDDKTRLIKLVVNDIQKMEILTHLDKINRKDLLISMLKRYVKKFEIEDLSILYKFYQKAISISKKEIESEAGRKKLERCIVKINMLKLSEKIDLDTLEEMKRIPFDDELLDYFNRLLLKYECLEIYKN